MTEFDDEVSSAETALLPAPKSPVTINLRPTWHGLGNYTFDADVRFSHPHKGQGHNNGNMRFINGPDTFMLTFTIANSPRRLQFVGVPDVLWLGPTPTCPPTSRWTMDAEITVYACLGDTLVLRNNNVTVREWIYALQMLDVDNNPVTYDPTISNGGGGSQLYHRKADEDGGEHRHRE